MRRTATTDNQVSVSELATILDQEMPKIDIPQDVVDHVADMMTADVAEGASETADSKKPIDLNNEQIDEINALAERLLQATESEAILATMAEIAKLHRRISRPIVESQVTLRADGTKLVGATTTIQCEDCGKDHIIKVQDVFQVKKCPDCQKKHRNAKRSEKRKEKRAEAKAVKDADKALADKLLAEHKAKTAEQSTEA